MSQSLRLYWYRVIASAMFTVAALGQAHAESLDVRPRLLVRPAAVVQDERILLGEIALIRSAHPEVSALVDDLAAIDLGEAPPPRLSTTIQGQSILDIVQAAGIPLNSFGYSIPQTIEVTRAGRIIERSEVFAEVKRKFEADSNLDVQVREVTWNTAQTIPVGETTFDIHRLGQPDAGKIPIRVTARVNGKPSARFLGTAVVDDWRAVPVVNRTLERGMLISPEDIEMVRLNMFKQPADTADRLDGVVGRRVKSRITAGSVVRKALIDIPPVIPQGTRVRMIYRSGAFSATATGVTLEDGHSDEMVRVKNEASRRIVTARVLNSDEVEVGAE